MAGVAKMPDLSPESLRRLGEVDLVCVSPLPINESLLESMAVNGWRAQIG